MSHDETSLEPAIDPALSQLLRHMLKIGASELILSSGSAAAFRVGSEVYTARTELKAEQVQSMLETVMTPVQLDDFSDQHEADLRVVHAAEPFRINVYMQRGAPGMVVRRVRTQAPSAEQVGLTEEQATRLLRMGGLVLCASSSERVRADLVAVLVDRRNALAPGHIVTVEAPLHYVHTSKLCVVTQRELGLDTCSYREALERALRQAPDMVALAELSDAESVETGLRLVARGQVVVAALPAASAADAIKQLLAMFPAARHAELRMRLAHALRGIVCRNPLPGSTEALGALELTLATPQVVGVIERGALHRLAVLAEGEGDGLGAHAYGMIKLRLAPEPAAPESQPAPAPAPVTLAGARDSRRQSAPQRRSFVGEAAPSARTQAR